jgi:hypothetical protein
MARKKQTQFTISGIQNLIINTSTIVYMKDRLSLFTGNGSELIELDIQIKADFKNIPPEYHHIFASMMTSRYGGVVNCYSNTEPFADKSKTKKKWWQFWKI